MAFSPITCATFICLIIACLSFGTEAIYDRYGSTKCNKLKAAFKYDNVLFFAYGDNKLAGFNEHGFKEFSGTLEDAGYTKPITAAFGDTYHNVYYLASHDTVSTFLAFHAEFPQQPVQWEMAKQEFKRIQHHFEGLDAAFERGMDRFVFFSKCDFVEVYRDRVFSEGHNSHLNLPCDVDAAWSSFDGKTAYIAKGTNVYPWRQDQKTAQPAQVLLHTYPMLYLLNICSV